MYKVILLITLIFVAALNANGAALGDILKDDSVASADAAALAAEAGVFDTLREGIAIEVARCAAEQCVPDVSRDELELLIKKLNNRISVISGRYQESGDKQLESILLSYATSRDSYNGFLDTLGTADSDEQKGQEGFPEENIEFKDEF